jgi:hypothetical protein
MRKGWLLVGVGLVMAGCANHLTMTRETQAKLSASVFLEPTADKTVYVEVKNTSGKPGAELADLPARLAGKGYRVVDTAEAAHLLVQVNTVYCSKAKPGTTLDTLLAGGFGATVGGIGGAAMAAARSSVRASSVAGVVGALAGGLIGMGVAKVTEDTVYVCAADVQLSERVAGEVRQSMTTRQVQPPERGQEPPAGLLGGLNQQRLAPPATPGVTRTQVEELTGPRRRHQTRAVAQAQKMWLDEQEALPALRSQLVEVISGLL